MSKRGKILVTVLAIIMGIVLITLIIGGIYSWRFVSGSHKIMVGSVDLSKVPDGTYEGSYSFFHDSSKVRVTVQDHHITAIESLTSGGAAKNDIPTLIERVIAQQSLQVDLVTGASVSQKVFLKAVESALSGAVS